MKRTEGEVREGGDRRGGDRENGERKGEGAEQLAPQTQKPNSAYDYIAPGLNAPVGQRYFTRHLIITRLSFVSSSILKQMVS
jgi:hypothetical protein